MAAYAALVSLMNLMDNIKNHPRLSTSLDKNQIESLGERIDFLLDFVENYNSHGDSKEAEDLESQIASAAHEAEDVIESHIVDQILPGSTEIIQDSNLSDLRCLFGLQKVILDMDSIKKKVIKFVEERGFKDQEPKNSVPAASSTPLTTGKNAMVGFDDELIQLMERLTGQQSDRQIIPIVGMGGIGKTTLARNVYQNLVIVQHFDIRAWVTVSQNYSTRKILLELLSCQRLTVSERDKKTEEELGVEFFKHLSSRRYLLILDDMWSIKAWNKIKWFFPDNGNRSRIVITTRLSNMAVHFSSSSFVMNFLDEYKSWNLFCEKAFGEEGCPPELVRIGTKIVKQCKGLPLSIVVIGGLLRRSYRTKEYWKNVAENIKSILNSGENEQILYLSYNHLPAHLKPCFLYMGIFPEDDDIRVSRLIKFWVAEGFLKPNGAQILEEIAEGCLKDLIDRNLILVGGRNSNGKIRSCRIHDLLRDLCLRVAGKEKFFYVVRALGVPQGIDRERRLVFHDSIPKHGNRGASHAFQSASLARSLICEGVQLPVKFRLLRVLSMAHDYSPEAIFQNFNLRFLTCQTLISKLPSSISLMWNLQTLIIRGDSKLIVAPFEIWKMSQLRHVEFNKIFLLDPTGQQDDFVVLENLRTLLKVVNFRWSEDACKRIPNIKKLHINYDAILEGYDGCLFSYLCNLGCLRKLESLNCFFNESPNWDDLLQNFTFPSSLKKLSLTNSSFDWEDLTIIGSLLHLEVLKLEQNSVSGSEWSPVEGEFLRLKFLKIYSCFLVYWNADSSHFPVLEKLVLGRLWYLNEIPSGIGEIPTLEGIYLDNCSISVTISAMQIQKEQESLGNDGLQVQNKTSVLSEKMKRIYEIESEEEGSD